MSSTTRRGPLRGQERDAPEQSAADDGRRPADAARRQRGRGAGMEQSSVVAALAPRRDGEQRDRSSDGPFRPAGREVVETPDLPTAPAAEQDGARSVTAPPEPEDALGRFLRETAEYLGLARAPGE